MQTSNWQEEFEKRQDIRHEDSFLDYGDDDCPPEINWEKIENFIAEVEKESIERAIEVVEKCDKEYQGDFVGEESIKALKTLLH